MYPIIVSNCWFFLPAGTIAFFTIVARTIRITFLHVAKFWTEFKLINQFAKYGMPVNQVVKSVNRSEVFFIFLNSETLVPILVFKHKNTIHIFPSFLRTVECRPQFSYFT